MSSIDEMIALLARGALGSADLQLKLGVSQPTISRMIHRAGERIIRLGRGRNTCYAAAESVFGAGYSQPIYRVDASGRVEQVATLRALAGGGYLVESAPEHFWLRGASCTGEFESLPYFLYDLRPSGFLGRLIARGLAEEWGFPPDPRSWGDGEIGEYLLRRGHDLPGDLVVGERAANLANQQIPPLTIGERDSGYPRMALSVLADEAPGSSAAGEQPKFAVLQRDAGHVVVKFSPATDTPEAARWQDLLRAEHHAQHLVSQHRVPAAESTLFYLAGRVFLESRRFDRRGLLGRRPALSLSMVDAEFVGLGRGWAAVAAALNSRGLLAEGDLNALCWAEAFGAWIGNSDMHLGNISLAPAEGRFALLPIYDMLPMAFAPVRGELPNVTLRSPIATKELREVWEIARLAAITFWSGIAGDGEFSEDFRELAGEQAKRIRGLG